MRVNEQWIGWRDETQRRLRLNFRIGWYGVYLFSLLCAIYVAIAGRPTSDNSAWIYGIGAGIMCVSLAFNVYQVQRALARVAAIAQEKAK